ncbi:hypothetical protein PHLGIDRAFT_18669 [Phlebiopsis gigantea 11061_1 CR5-6]|uniref:Uncharacterized protein n=1 Tax=Phlebiopsis gigantea (strain 11061_1 CR5-6) TaxID=745531 RepID=A0A0C3PQB8_PHLG1|nr:hypothetical protein PHLGIDRAFT_18669 [Phlebiopsis gigantea 11061_1 CR5-6]
MNAMYTRNGAHLPIPRVKVVQQVAQFVAWIIKKEAERQINSAQFPRFGPGFLTLDQLYLLELKQISAASYQIILGIVIPQPVLASAPYASNTFAPEGFELGFETFSLGDVYQEYSW